MSALFDNATISRIQQATDIVELISEYLSLAPKGTEMVGVCPFHEDHRPSMYVNSGKQIFKCFACGAGGDVFKFVQLKENLTFPQAVERLAERAVIELKQTYTPTQSQNTGPDPNMLVRVNTWASTFFQRNLTLPEAQYARDYLSERQIEPETVKKWKIGLSIGKNNDLLKAAARQNINTSLLQAAGLIAKGSDRFVNRLMFPISDVTGRIIAFGGRTLENADAKYINSPTSVVFDKSNNLFGLAHGRKAIGKADTAVIVEGYTDCIIPHQLGCENFVATLGTSFTAGHARILRRYAKSVVLLFDSDTAGMAASQRALDICLGQRLDIKLAFVPSGKDPCEFALSAGREGLEQIVADAQNIFEFKWKTLKQQLDAPQTLDGTKRAVDDYLGTIAQAIGNNSVNIMERGLIANRLASVIGIKPQQINAELDKIILSKTRSQVYTQKNQKVTSVKIGQSLPELAQREIMEVLLNAPELFTGKGISVDMFDIPVLTHVATIISEMVESNFSDPESVLGSVLCRCESVETSNLITDMAVAGQQKANFENRLDDALVVLNRCRKEQQNAKLLRNEPDDFLRVFTENAEKTNPHRLGMI
jgi:DNA primase